MIKKDHFLYEDNLDNNITTDNRCSDDNACLAYEVNDKKLKLLYFIVA